MLALSDAHIPDRAVDLPSKFKKLLSIPDKISQVAVLGNSSNSSEFLKFVTDITPNVHIVRGEFDRATIPAIHTDKVPVVKTPGQERTIKSNRVELPMNAVITQGEFRIGCCSGYTVVPKNDPVSLLTLARQLDVDILLWGGTYNVEAYTLEGKFFINPEAVPVHLTPIGLFFLIYWETLTLRKKKQRQTIQARKAKTQRTDQTTCMCLIWISMVQMCPAFAC